jgi:acyl-CoA thioesterase I
MRKAFFASLIVLLAISAGFFLLGGDEHYVNVPARGENVIAFGDSLVEGVGSTSGNDFVSLLARSLQTPIINKGISGNTTAMAVERLEADVLTLNPKVVVVLLGGNDFLRRVPREETFKNLETIVDRIHETGAAVLLLGVRGGLLGDSYEKDFKRFAARKGIMYVPNVLDGLLGNKEYMSDQIHPNDKGYEMVAKKVEPALRKLLESGNRE